MSATHTAVTTEEAINEAAVATLDIITSTYTGFTRFELLLNAKGGYRPTINTRCKVNGKVMRLLADAYDLAQTARGDARRAFRG